MFLRQRKHRLQNASIRSIIFMYFTITALAASVFIGVSLYGRLSGQMSSALQEENHILINQLGRTMDSYLRLVMKLSDSLYYGVIKNADLSDGSINGEITLLYDNKQCPGGRSGLVYGGIGKNRKSSFFHASCTAYF